MGVVGGGGGVIFATCVDIGWGVLVPGGLACLDSASSTPTTTAGYNEKDVKFPSIFVMKASFLLRCIDSFRVRPTALCDAIVV